MERLGTRCKQLMVEEIKEKIKNSSNFFITSFSSMGVGEQDDLRQKLKNLDVSLLVVKNRLAKRAFKQLKQEQISSLFQGLTGISLGGSDSIATSKTLVDFAGKHEGFKILAAYAEKQFLDVDSVKRLASIPSREVLLTQLVRAINSPVQGLVNALSGTIKKFVLVIDKIREKQGGTK